MSWKCGSVDEHGSFCTVWAWTEGTWSMIHICKTGDRREDLRVHRPYRLPELQSQKIKTTFLLHIPLTATATAKSLQSCPTLCDPRDGSPPGSPVPGILQARTLEWVAISVSNAWKWKVKGKSLSSVRLLATPWTAAYQAPLSMGFARQEYWSGLPLPSPTHTAEDCGKSSNNRNSWGFWTGKQVEGSSV